MPTTAQLYESFIDLSDCQTLEDAELRIVGELAGMDSGLVIDAEDAEDRFAEWAPGSRVDHFLLFDKQLFGTHRVRIYRHCVDGYPDNCCYSYVVDKIN